MPRLLIITTNFPRWPGDPHSPWLVELLGLLREQGIRIEVLAPAYAGQGNQNIYGMSVHRFRYAPARWETLTHDKGAPNKIRRNPWYLLLLPIYLSRVCWLPGGWDVAGASISSMYIGRCRRVCWGWRHAGRAVVVWSLLSMGPTW